MIDLAHNTANDLSKKQPWVEIRRELPNYDVLGIDLPCNTWTRARRAPTWSRWPSALRGTGNEIWGLQDLSFPDKKKVRAANTMAREAVKTIKASIGLGQSGYMENPASSRLWELKEVKQMVKTGKCKLICFDQCQYGTAWRKRTRFLTWGRFRDARLDLCKGVEGKCSRTGKPHVQLIGATAAGFLSAQAQVFPLALGTALFKQWLSHHMECGKRGDPKF